ncbi:hypothetical protein RAS1_10260 [Phycisphaerae bacterium RAS1]|nr:hypothetical protein RAS1_10260 [Phycisphaerae bacterium RAS1]
MKRIVLAAAMASFVVSAASAQTAAARWFLSSYGLSDPADPQSPAVAPADYGTNPVIPVGAHRLYVWVNTPTGGRIWNGFQDYAFEARGGNLSITNVEIYNYRFGPPDPEDPPEPYFRWAYASEGDNDPDGGGAVQSVTGVTMFTVGGMGVRNTALPLGGDPHFWNASGSAARSTLVGHIELTGTTFGELFIRHDLASAQSATGGIASANTFVRLGFGDEGTVYTGGAGGDSPIAEATMIPEPAGMALLMLGAVAMRRR